MADVLSTEEVLERVKSKGVRILVPKVRVEHNFKCLFFGTRPLPKRDCPFQVAEVCLQFRRERLAE